MDEQQCEPFQYDPGVRYAGAKFVPIAPPVVTYGGKRSVFTVRGPDGYEFQLRVNHGRIYVRRPSVAAAVRRAVRRGE